MTWTLTRKPVAARVLVALIMAAVLPAVMSAVSGSSLAPIRSDQRNPGAAVFLESALVAADLGGRIAVAGAERSWDLIVTAFADYTGMDDRPESEPLSDPELEEVIGAGGLPTPDFTPTPTPRPSPTALPG